jgi:hypothetical protein
MPARFLSAGTPRPRAGSGNARAKLLRLLGAVLVTVALVPWLGVPAATATPGGKGAGAAAASKGHDQDGSHGRSAQKQGSDDGGKHASPVKGGRADHARNADKGGSGEAAAQPAAKADKAPKAAKAAKAGTSGKAAAPAAKTQKRNAGKPKAAAPKAAAPKAAAPKAAAPKADGAGKQADGKSTAGGPGYQKVTLCHRTNSENNPYVRITVSVNSVVKSSGHDGHVGPIHVPGMKAAGQRWGDVIPSFSYTTKSGGTATYGGKNWPAGQALLERGCVASQPTTTPSQSPTPTTPTPTPTTPTPSDTPTTVTPTPSETTGGPSLTPSNTTPPATSVLPTKVPGPDDDDDGTVVRGNKFGPLADTGLQLPLGVLIALSLVLLLVGGALLAGPSWNSAEQRRRH